MFKEGAASPQLVRWMDRFGFDTRSLGLCRWLVGLVVFIDAVMQSSQIRDFYTDFGIMPRAYWITEFMSPGRFSFHLASGDLWFQVILFAIHIVAAFCFMVGYRWRLSVIVTFLMMSSMHSRDLMVISGADLMMRLALFWFMFQKHCGEYAVDRLSQPRNFRINGIEVQALGFQLLLVYICAGIFKLHPIYTEQFAGVYYMWNVDGYAKYLAIVLREHLLLTKVLSILTVFWELCGPVLAFLPFWATRSIAAFGFQYFHMGIWATLSLWLFPWIAMAHWSMFYPSELWATPPFRYLDRGLNRLTLRLRSLLRVTPPSVDPVLKPMQVRVRHLAVAVCMTIAIIYNLDGLGALQMKPWFKKMSISMGLHQKWNLFGPYPYMDDGWWIISGTFENGEVRNLLTGGEVTQERPAVISEWAPTNEWRKFMLNVWHEYGGHPRVMKPLKEFLCRKHRLQEPKLKSLNVTFMKEATPPIGKPFPSIVEINFGTHECKTTPEKVPSIQGIR